MKIIIDEMPKSSSECSFALLPQSEYDNTLIANCQLKCNSFPWPEGQPAFCHTPNRFTCSLANKSKCPFLIESKF